MQKPNILILFTDQQRFDALGKVNPHIKTPHLDRLAQRGCLYQNAYSPNPVCVPARHNLLTGLTSRYHGFARNISRPMKHQLPTLPGILSNHGYYCEAIGKMHFHPMRNHHGFHRMQLMEETPKYRQDDDYLLYLQKNNLGHIQHQHGIRHLLYHQPQRSLIPMEHHGSKWVADRTLDFLDNNQHQPFFLWSSWIHPHPPFHIPDELADNYKDCPLPEPIAETDPLHIPPGIRDTLDFGDFNGDPKKLRRQTEAYYNAVSFVDQQIGRVLDKLDELGLTENTLIIFTSDHGEMLGDLNLFQKSMPYEGAAHIPFIASFPDRIPANTVNNDFVDLNDILPTALDAANISYPGEFDLPGESLLQENTQKDRSVQYVENGWVKYEAGANRWVMMMDQNYKYAHFVNGGYEWLIDRKADPQEKNNLMIDHELTTEQKNSYLRLKQKAIEYEKKWGLKEAIVNNDFVSYDEFSKNKKIRMLAKPSWPPQLTKQSEKDQLNSIEKELFEAVAKEPTVNLKELDLETWENGTGLQEIAEKIRNLSS